MKKQCPCCKCYTIEEEYDICPVCYWEYDEVQNGDPDFSGGANDLSLRDAAINYSLFGASEYRFLEKVRKPFEQELSGEAYI